VPPKDPTCTKTAPPKMALLKKEFAEQLDRFRNMPGTRIDRMRILKEIRVSNGEPATLYRIDAEIRRAIRYENVERLLIIKGIHEKRKPLREIPSSLKLPKSTIARFIRKLRHPGNPPEADSRFASIAPIHVIYSSCICVIIVAAV